MQWLDYALIGITIWSATAVADRFFLLRHVRSKRFYVVVPALLQFTVLLIATMWFGIPSGSPIAILSAFGSGVTSAISLYYLYVAIGNDEVSRVFPLSTGGPIFTLILGWLFLRELLTLTEGVALVLFVCGGFLLAARFASLRKLSFSRAIKPLFIGSLLSSVFTILLRSAFVASGFWAGFFYSRFGFFIAGLVILGFFYREIKEEWDRQRSSIRWGLLANQLVSFSGHAFYFLALSLASAALVQSVLGAQSAIVFVFAVAVSLWSPRIIEESTSTHDLVQKGIGILFVIAAAALLALS